MGSTNENTNCDSSVGRQQRSPNPLWDVVCELFGLKPVTKAEQGRMGVVVRDLKLKGATPDEVRKRYRQYKLKFPTWTLTETALVKHWDRLEERHTQTAMSNAEFLKRMGVE